MTKNNNKKTFLQKLRYKYKLIVINEDTFEQKASLRLSRFNLYSIASGILLILVIAIISLIAFTPIKFYLPGVGSLDMRSKLIELELLTDSLDKETEKRNFWVNNVQMILAEEIDSSFYFSDSTLLSPIKEIDLSKVSENELEFREKNEVEFNIKEDNTLNSFSSNSFNMITPVEGYLIKDFSKGDEHNGIDIAAQKGAPVKAILDGMVISSEWNPETGNVIAIQHKNDIVSFYKHNSILLKKVGSFVKRGDVIALVGSSGSMSSGAHLHFELWINSKSVNPLEYLFIEKLN